jgi:hypothetical protein
VISGAFYRQGDSVLLEADFTDARTRKLLQSVGPISAPLSAPLQGVERLRQRVTGSLAAVVDTRLAELAGLTSEPPSYDAYREFLAGENLFYTDDSAAIAHYRNASALDSSYLFPLLREMAALSNIGSFASADSVSRQLQRKRSLLSPYEASYLDNLLANDGDDPPAAYAAAKAMMDAAPKADFPVYLAADYANGVNKPREALALLKRLDPEAGALRGRIYYFNYYGSALHALGDYERELEIVKQGRRQYPGRLFIAGVEVPALAALGKTVELEALLREIRTMAPDLRTSVTTVFCDAIYELRAHDHPEAALAVRKELLAWMAEKPARETATKAARSERMDALIATHRWADVRPLADSVDAEDSANIDAIGARALAEAEIGDRAAALRSVASIVGGHNQDGTIREADWRASVAAALGNKAEALAELERGYPGGGVPNYSWHNSILYELLRDYPPFQDYIRPKG